METWEIKGHVVEYIDESHTYLVDGIILPSITQILKVKFGNKYQGISKEVLDNAAAKGTRVHEAIEKWYKYNVTRYMLVLTIKSLKNEKGAVQSLWE